MKGLMKKTKKSDVLVLLRPMHVFSRVFGLTPYTFEGRRVAKGRFHLLYALYSLLILSCCLLNFLLSPVSRKPLRLLHDISNVSMFVSCIITTLASRSDAIKTAEKLREIQWDLQDFRFRKRSYHVLTSLCLLTATLMCICNIYWNVISYGRVGIYFASVYYLTNYVITIHCFNFAGHIHVIYLYLDHLKKSLSTVDWTDEGDEWRKRVIALRRVYGKIWLVARILNINYNVSLMVIFAATFMNVTETIYLWLKTDFVDDEIMLVDSIFWMLSNVFRIVYIAATCERIKSQVEEIANVVHAKLLQINEEKDNYLMLQFSLQLIHENIEFWACGLFKINNNLLYTMLGAIITYSVLIFQLKAY